jgi:O-antigen ligase
MSSGKAWRLLWVAIALFVVGGITLGVGDRSRDIPAVAVGLTFVFVAIVLGLVLLATAGIKPGGANKEASQADVGRSGTPEGS